MNKYISRVHEMLRGSTAPRNRRADKTPGSALKYFRSVVVLGKLDASIAGDTYASHLGRWIERFDAFERRHFGFDRGQNQSLATGRTILFTGADILSAIDEQLSVCDLAWRKGLASTVRVPIVDALAKPTAYADLIGSKSVVSSIILDSGTLAHADSPSELKRIVSESIQANKTLSFTGTISYWLDSGILGDPGINGEGFSLSGTSGRKDAGLSVAPHDPCASRFQVFVSDTGGIFPCQGLVGTTFGQIGHITASDGDVLSVADWTELGEWAKRGPVIRDLSAPAPGALPSICRRHREDLQLRGASLSGA